MSANLPHLYLPRSPNPLLLLDQDGPLAAFDDHVWSRGTDQGWAFDIEGVHQQANRYLSDHLPSGDERDACREMCAAPGWFRDLPVVPGSQEGVEVLLERGIDVWVCTKPMESNPTCASDKQWWVEKHFPALARRVIVTPNKGMVVGDVLLDDAPMPSWFEYACWDPMIYQYGYNGGGSRWGDVPRFTWDMPIEVLVDHLDRARSGR